MSRGTPTTSGIEALRHERKIETQLNDDNYYS